MSRITLWRIAVTFILSGIMLGAFALSTALVDGHSGTHEPAPSRTAITTWQGGHVHGLLVTLDVYGFSGASLDGSIVFTNDGDTSLSIIAVRFYVGDAVTAWDDLARFDTPAFGQMIAANDSTTFVFTGTAPGTGTRLVAQVLYQGVDVESGIDHDQTLFFELTIPIPEAKT